MPRRPTCLLAVVLALGLFGCSGSEESASESVSTIPERETTTAAGATTSNAAPATLRPLTELERAWVKRYSRWAGRAFVPIQTAVNIRVRWRFILLDPDYTGRPVAQYRRNLPRVAECPDTLTSDVGDPPGERLTKAYELLGRGCELFVNATESDAQAIAANDIDAFDASEDTWDEAVLALQQADEAVVALLRHKQPLPEKRGTTKESRVEPVFGDVVSRITVENHEVRCWSERDWPIVIKDRLAYEGGHIDLNLLGFAAEGQPLHLAPEVCTELARFRYDRWRPESGVALRDLAEAVDVLVHEAEHGVGIMREAVAECYAVQGVREAARLLGASRAYADRLAEVNWTEVYPYLPSQYVTDACRDGGPLDQRPRSPRWP